MSRFEPVSCCFCMIAVMYDSCDASQACLYSAFSYPTYGIKHLNPVVTSLLSRLGIHLSVCPADGSHAGQVQPTASAENCSNRGGRAKVSASTILQYNFMYRLQTTTKLIITVPANLMNQAFAIGYFVVLCNQTRRVRMWLCMFEFLEFGSALFPSFCTCAFTIVFMLPCG
jgi:hypothetical protein